MDGIDKAGGATGLAPLRPTPVATAPAASAPVTADAKTPAAAQTSDLFALLADASAPVDTKKVDAIKSLVASGAYPIDAHAVAAKMMALDFPASGDHADA
jgi:negative regulator of flagellin synthesis FlgM